MLSHELRNPLAPIVTAAQVLGKIAPNDTRIAWVREVVERQVTHLAGLVDDLLDVSRITQGKITLKREAVELGKVASRTASRSCGRCRLETASVDGDACRHADLGVRRLLALEPDLQQRAAQRRKVHDRRRPDRARRQRRSRHGGGSRSRQRYRHRCRSSCRTSSRCLLRAIAGSTAARAGSALASRWYGVSWSCIRGRSRSSAMGHGTGTEVSVVLPCISEVVPHGRGEDGASAFAPSAANGCSWSTTTSMPRKSIAVFMRIEGHEVKTVNDGEQALACLAGVRAARRASSTSACRV